MYLHGEGAEAGLDKDESALTEEQLKLAGFLVKNAKNFYNLGCIRPLKGGGYKRDNKNPVWPGMTAVESELFVDFRNVITSDIPLGRLAESYVTDLAKYAVDLAALEASEGEVSASDIRLDRFTSEVEIRSGEHALLPGDTRNEWWAE